MVDFPEPDFHRPARKPCASSISKVDVRNGSQILLRQRRSRTRFSQGFEDVKGTYQPFGFVTISAHSAKSDLQRVPARNAAVTQSQDGGSARHWASCTLAPRIERRNQSGRAVEPRHCSRDLPQAGPARGC